MKNFRKNIFLRWGIAPKFILAILFFSTLVTLILTLIQVYTGYKDGLESIDRSIIQIEGSYLDSIINDLWLSDTELLQTHLSGMMKLRDIQYIDVVSRHETLAKIGVFTEKHVVKKEFPLTYTYSNKTISLGKLRIHYTLDNLYERLKKSAISIILFQSIVIFLVSGFFFFIFYLLVARHLYALVDYSKSLRVKTLDTPFSLKLYKNSWGEDEFDILVRAINEMRMDLSESYSRLKVENSERLQAEKALKESEEEYRLLYQQAPVMLHNIDMEGRLTEVNEQWLKTLGYERGDVLGRCSIEFLTPESKQYAINLFPELYEKGLLKDTEYQFVTKQGDVRDVLLTAHMVNKFNDESFFNFEDVSVLDDNQVQYKQSSAWWSPLIRGTCKICAKPAISYANLKVKKFAIVPSASIPNEIKSNEVCCHGFYGSRDEDALDSSPKFRGFWSSQFMTLWYLVKGRYHQKST